jgi:hypothetical protein
MLPASYRPALKTAPISLRYYLTAIQLFDTTANILYSTYMTHESFRYTTKSIAGPCINNSDLRRNTVLPNKKKKEECCF